MLKGFWNSIKNFFANLGSSIKAIFNPGYADSFDEKRKSAHSLETQAMLNGSQYQNASDPSQLYNYYNQMGEGALSSLSNKYTEAGITGQQAALNEMQMDNQRRQYAFNVQGMQEAGLNPALMYESGATSAPSAPAPTQGMSMSELLQALLFDKQSKLLDAQARNTDADTDKKKAETDNMKLINQYYPSLTQTTIDKMLKEMGLTDAQIEDTFANVNSKNLDVELKSIEKVIKQAQADESSAYYKATRELAEAQTDKERAEKEKLVVERAMELIEKEYMQHTNTKMGSAAIVAVASALGTLFSNFNIDFDSEGFKEKFNKKFNDILDWINKPKKAPWVK